MSQDLDARLKTAVEKRDRLAAEAQRIAGRKEAAEKALQDVESEIRAKNLDPDTLDETIQQLDDAYSASVESFEQEITAATEALAPYTESQ
jgi:hypothetical protein